MSFQGLEGQCHGVGEGKCDAYVLMKIGTNEVEVTQGQFIAHQDDLCTYHWLFVLIQKRDGQSIVPTPGSREDKVADDDNPKMSLPSDGYTANKPREYEFRVMGFFVSFIP